MARNFPSSSFLLLPGNGKGGGGGMGVLNGKPRLRQPKKRKKSQLPLHACFPTHTLASEREKKSASRKLKRKRTSLFFWEGRKGKYSYERNTCLFFQREGRNELFSFMPSLKESTGRKRGVAGVILLAGIPHNFLKMRRCGRATFY